MSAVAALILFLAVLLIWSGLTGQALFVGSDAAIPKVFSKAKV